MSAIDNAAAGRHFFLFDDSREDFLREHCDDADDYDLPRYEVTPGFNIRALGLDIHVPFGATVTTYYNEKKEITAPGLAPL